MIRNKRPVTHWRNFTNVVSQRAMIEAALLNIHVNGLSKNFDSDKVSG